MTASSPPGFTNHLQQDLKHLLTCQILFSAPVLLHHNLCGGAQGVCRMNKLQGKLVPIKILEPLINPLELSEFLPVITWPHRTSVCLQCLQILLLFDRITDIENRLVVAKGEGVGGRWSRRLGLADLSFYT